MLKSVTRLASQNVHHRKRLVYTQKVDYLVLFRRKCGTNFLEPKMKLSTVSRNKSNPELTHSSITSVSIISFYLIVHLVRSKLVLETFICGVFKIYFLISFFGDVGFSGRLRWRSEGLRLRYLRKVELEMDKYIREKLIEL